MKIKREPASFRDPDGFVYVKQGTVYRKIQPSFITQYRKLLQSGLYQQLTQQQLLIPHEETRQTPSGIEIKPQPIPFITYPYEWTFNQLRSAALTTLAVQKQALEFDMSLKDASAYNIQFLGNQPRFIDTLSFEELAQYQPWVAYRQFCEHFLAPLALMSRVDVGLNRLFIFYHEGIPLELASRLLPINSYLNFPILLHLHLHARFQKQQVNRKMEANKHRRFGKKALVGLTETLEQLVKSLKVASTSSHWNSYYVDNTYSMTEQKLKMNFVITICRQLKPKLVWDLGANTGVYSRHATQFADYVIAMDSDHDCSDSIFMHEPQTKILPLWIDLTNPSPALGWESQERKSLLERGPADLVLALALMHHLAIGNNITFTQLARFFSKIARHLLIEFIPKTDSQVKRLLAFRRDIFNEYSEEKFITSFGKYFRVTKKISLGNNGRSLFAMRRLV
ncbi:TPA: SAM-dependent methyltransferase [Patescibacteria group bacterium]|uniref:Nodulation protein NoeA-related protein n=1 Tax=Candidatus Gottesmanbacteria bacterium GW2011_GWA1_43_11 TaxID=1618436 RepID=A0A0G1CHZ9_9BACT|nr:MAG: Nodulation protein NoeA-related protein [Candidatus Gottesmanbacteria bacterium GW2011_GWA1_43_11]HCS79048.1 SAM-dependent methyltransferase [Patescibacteria group bacterium]